MSEVSLFYALTHIFISLIGGILLLAIWYNIRKRFIQLLEENESEKRVDKGLLFLSLALFVWAISGCWVYVNNGLSFAGTIGYTAVLNLFSVLNNIFLLLALSYFYYAPKFIYQNKRNVRILAIIIVIVSVATVILSNYDQANSPFKISAFPDLVLSAFLSLLLMISLYKTFLNSGLAIIAVISVLVTALVFVSQLPEVFNSLNDGFINNLIKLISKVSLITLFMVLATTWVIRLANMPKPNEVTIAFLDWSMIKISIPSKGVFNEVVDFESKTTQYKNLLKFAIRRKFAEGNEQTIQIGNGGELNNQTYLSRIIDNMNDILNLDPLQKLERRDIFTFIGEGNYRLRITPENITIDTTLLKEASQSLENPTYDKLCN
ncbi:MAG: hypothetical protein GQ574_01490 [Crocinitomix sp.]|nr:hypothetical protein [Crocinitomix sp.]